MSKKLFIGGLSWGTTDQSMMDAFSAHGQVVSAEVVRDRETGRSKGFGFVEYASEEDAAAAKTALDGQMLDGRKIRVDFAREQERGGGPRGFGRSGGDRRGR